MFKLLRFIFSSLLAIAIAACYFQAWVPPTILGKGVFLGFAFPYIWVAGLVVAIFLMAMRAKASFVVLCASLLITLGGMSAIMRLWGEKQQQHEGKQLKMVTMNICNLKGGNMGTDLAVKDMQQLFADADIVFLQEAPNEHKMTRTFQTSLKQLLGFEYQAYDRSNYSKSKYDASTQVILSRYPITVDDSTDDDTDRHIMSAYITVDGQKIRLINCHLESIRLSAEQINTVSNVSRADIHRGQGTKAELQETYSKMRTAFDRRTMQTIHVVDLIKSDTTPIIVGGDFNDTPISFTYHKVSDLLFDTFRNSNVIFGNTFNSSLPPIRIDYIFHSSQFTSSDYLIHTESQSSDHYAVSAVLKLKANL